LSATPKSTKSSTWVLCNREEDQIDFGVDPGNQRLRATV
jgi:hypothetical protein